jgi:hypothetical protein
MAFPTTGPRQSEQQPAGGDVEGVPRVGWPVIAGELVDLWDQGQHVAILGKTNSGKTTLALELCRLRIAHRGATCGLLGTKARDSTLKATGWPIVREWPPTYAQLQTHHVIFWPAYSRPSTAKATTAPRVMEILDEVMLSGGWTLFVDEMAYLVETLGLRFVLDEYWNGARSSGISLIAGTQRPAWLARSAVSQTDWTICFRINDLEDRKRAAEILGNRQRYTPVIGALRDHEFLLVRTVNDMAVVTKLPRSRVNAH